MSTAPDGPLKANEAALARHIATMSINGDPVARNAYTTLSGYLAEGVANVFNILDPEAVMVSGGLIEGQPTFLAEVQATVQSPCSLWQ